jgi:hypothetical protein
MVHFTTKDCSGGRHSFYEGLSVPSLYLSKQAKQAPGSTKYDPSADSNALYPFLVKIV